MVWSCVSQVAEMCSGVGEVAELCSGEELCG